MLEFGCTLPNLVKNCLHKSTDANFYPFTQEDKDFVKKRSAKTLLVVHLSFSHANQLLMKLLIESLQTYANLLLVLVPATYIPTRCVNTWPLVFTRVGISIQKPVDSHFDKTRAVALKV